MTWFSLYHIYLIAPRGKKRKRSLQTLSSKDKVAFSAPSGRPKGKQYLQGEDLDIKCDNSGKSGIRGNILRLEVMRCCRQLPEIYNMVFQYHTQPLLDVFEAFLLVHFHCAQPVWPMRITPTYFNPADTLQRFKLCNLSSESDGSKNK